jgi:hypothetical protein
MYLRLFFFFLRPESNKTVTCIFDRHVDIYSLLLFFSFFEKNKIHREVAEHMPD